MQQILQQTFIPNELIQHNQWVLWKLENINGKHTKVPYQINGYKANSTDSDTWTSYETALNIYKNSNQYNGLGFVLTESDPYTVIDLDDCIENGKIKPEAKTIIDTLDSYTEISQSGKGLHIFIKGKKPGNRSKNSKKGIEIYDKKRFIVMTGNHLEGTSTKIFEQQEMLNYIYDMCFSDDDQGKRQGNLVQTNLIQSPKMTDEQILKIAFNAKNADEIKALYSGNFQSYGSQSEADQALCNHIAFYTQDPLQIDRIFIRSGLYREKWDREDYKQRTIKKALDGLKNTYQKYELHVNDRPKEPKLVLTKEGNVKKLLSNLREILLFEPKLKGIGFNEFTQEVTINNETITDSFISELRLSVDSKYQVTFSKDDVMDMTVSIAKERNSYHPIKQMIESKKWDGTPRAETIFIDYLGADDIHYTRSVAKKWLAGAVARIYEPGIKMEIVPVLQGKQGIGKSTLVSKLGGEYFLDTLASLGNSKDDYQLLIGTWIVELAELASLDSTKTEKVKSFISANFDKIRLPYDKIPSKHYRTSVFIGTTNTGQFLNDLTGNRRFFPIPLQNKPKKDVFSLDNETIQQIWAEAYSLYKNGEKLFLDDQLDVDVADYYRKQATEESLFFIHIDDYLEMKVPKDWNKRSMIDKKIYFERYQQTGEMEGSDTITKTTSKEIAYMLGLEPKDRNANAQMKKINLYMDGKEDWEKKPIKIYGKTHRGYMRK